jgi:hypothetical protein
MNVTRNCRSHLPMLKLGRRVSHATSVTIVRSSRDVLWGSVEILNIDIAPVCLPCWAIPAHNCVPGRNRRTRAMTADASSESIPQKWTSLVAYTDASMYASASTLGQVTPSQVGHRVHPAHDGPQHRGWIGLLGELQQVKVDLHPKGSCARGASRQSKQKSPSSALLPASRRLSPPGFIASCGLLLALAG